MEIKQIIRAWDFPKNTIINRNLPKATLYKQMMDAKKKEFLQNSVQTIYWMASYKTDNTNIKLFSSDEELYTEVEFIYVQVRNDDVSDKVYKTIAELIPYPLVVLMEDPNKLHIVSGRYERKTGNVLRLTKVYKSSDYNEVAIIQFLNKLTLKNLPKSNFKVFYDTIRDIIINDEAKARDDIDDDVLLDANVSDQLNELDKLIERTKNAAKKEKQLHKAAPLYKELNKLKEQRKIMLGALKIGDNN